MTDVAAPASVLEPPARPFGYRLLIGGEWREAVSGARYMRESPAHDVPVGEYPLAGVEDVDAAVAAAREAFDEGRWPRAPGAERAKAIHRVGDLIRDQAEELAYVEVLESGKPIAQARAELAGTAELWEYAATLARHAHGDVYNTLGEDMLGLLVREPVGVVGVITPWNFPLLIVSQVLPFALAVGCTAVVKPSELTPGSTLRLGELCAEAGLPAGVVNVVVGEGVPAGARLADHNAVDMLAFTGSTGVGKLVVAASRGNLKRVSLELGGKNPQIIFADADLEAALDSAVFGAYFNQGECCVSGSRLLLQDEIADDFVAEVAARSVGVPVGDPLSEETKVGAIVTDEQLQRILGYVDAGTREGAELRTGGARLPTERGRFVAPTVFDHVTPAMTIATEEIFGPVVSALRFRDAEEAVRIANGTVYGLSASVWTRDVDRALQVAGGVRAGTVWVNTYMSGYPEMSFGGYKQSGLGRELGRHAIEEFTELKGIHLHVGPHTDWWHRTAGEEPS